MTATVCEKCHRPLKDAASQRRRYGPVCFRRVFGAPPPARGIGPHHTASAPAAEPHPVDPDQIPLPLETLVETFAERGARTHAEPVARGEHDDRCEYLAVAGFYLCHCSKRRREAAGHTTPPDDLVFRPPYCPRCDQDVHHDGDSWTCPRCSAHWEADGSNAQFYDDYGDLDADLAKWRERAAKKAATVQEGQNQ